MTTFGALVGCAAPDVPHYSSDPARMPEIDVHCHVFNIYDMPFYQMFVQVILDEKMAVELARPLARLIISTARSAAPDAATEIEELKRMAALRLTNGLDNPARDPIRLFQAGIDDFVKNHVEAARTKSATGEHAAAENAAFLKQLYFAFSPDKALPGPRDLSASDYGAFFRDRAPAVAQGMKAHAGAVRRRPGPRPKAAYDNFIDVASNMLVNWAPLYSKYRYRLASQLLNFVGSPRPLRFVAPAILDVENWMEPDPYYDTGPPTSPADEVKLMSLLSLVQPSGVALHGFIGFDPVRYIRDKESLEIVKQAVLSHGFVGVKLYPPMGFRPIGNCEIPLKWFPEHLRRIPRLGERLDEALLALYRFCVAKDVPIMAHCGESNGPSPEARQQAKPEYWKEVLKLPNMSTLRLNLAHAGGLWGFHDSKDPNVWTSEVAAMLADADRKYPNLYADVGDVANFLEGTHDQETKDLIKNLRDLKPAAKARLMYGTDWTFLGRMPNAQR